MSINSATEIKRELDFLPYGRQDVDDTDINRVVSVLKSDWLTQGPTVVAFEEALAKKTTAEYAVTCSNGTSALHLTMLALGIGEGDKVVTSPVTFVASANCARFVGAQVGFVDVDPDTALMSPEKLDEIIAKDTKRTIKAVIPVHFAGQPADLPAIHDICSKRSIPVIDDCCHAIGAWYETKGKKHILGGNSQALMSAFSFHPVKHIACGEGGAITTADPELYDRLCRLRNHGISREKFFNEEMAYDEFGSVNPWYHELHDLSPNYRLSDIHSALGLSQLKKLECSLERRNILADLYDEIIKDSFAPDEVRPLERRAGSYHAFHLYVLQIDFERFKISRAEVMNGLRNCNIGTQVHYIPVHLQPYYRSQCGTGPGDMPNAESYYSKALSIPMYPGLKDSDCERVISALKAILRPR